MTNLQEAHGAFPSCYSSLFHTRYSDALFRKARCREEGVCVWGCCPFSEATLRKAVRFFENSSYPLSPVPHRRKATGNVCQRTREDAIYSPLLLVQNEGGKHWERKRGAAGSKALGLIQKWTGERAREEGGGSWRRKNEREGTEKDADWFKEFIPFYCNGQKIIAMQTKLLSQDGLNAEYTGITMLYIIWNVIYGRLTCRERD